MIKNKLAYKIAAAYMAVILVTALIMTASFYALMKNYTTRAVREDLLQDAVNLTQLLEKTSPEGIVLPKGETRLLFRLAGKYLKGDYLVVSQEGNVVLSSLESLPAGSKPGKLLARRIQRVADTGQKNIFLEGSEYLSVVKSFSSQGVSGWVVTLARPEGMQALNKNLSGVFLKSLGISFLASLVMALILTGKISKYLALLRDKAHRVARRDYGPGLCIDTGDELQELGEAFNAMEQQIKEYDEAQKKFFQNASHELKTPLMSIQGYAEGIRDGTIKGDGASRGLEIIARECQRLKGIVEDIVYLGRLESPAEQYNYEAVDLEEVISQSLETTGILAREKGVEIKANAVALKDIYVRADGQKLVRVFVNILGNAVRHAAKEIVLEGKSIEGKKVLVRVSDDGPGFAPGEAEKIWDRFYKGPGGNAGLGMSIVKAVVTAHGGAVRAMNRDTGPGAAVEVELASV